ncbi:MAG TPA: zinc ribbon domain-containing protein [Glaciihabitans sp.]|jgi:hypothetical protein|nr:zinc ribbon domain-containing protein [Glaciihabitans sp.]
MHRCPTCGTENRESARFCDNCGTPLTAEVPQDSNESRWGVFHRWSGAWAIAQWFSPTGQEAIDGLNDPSKLWGRGDDPYSTISNSNQSYLGLVRESGNGPLVVIEWYLVNWSDADGGKWVKGDATPAPEGNSITLTSME